MKRKTPIAISNEITHFISKVRDILPTEEICLQGRCYQLAQLLKHVFPEVEIWYSDEEGHVYSKIGKFFYDIRGAWSHIDNLRLLDHQRGHKPHRWKGKF